MFNKILSSIFGTSNDRIIKSLDSIINEINSFEDELKKLSDKALKDKTPRFKKLLEDGKSLDDILPEAFAVVREASVRTLGMRHFDVQLKGGVILHKGMISEMKTGEGKTLVATLPAYLNALTGKGVHIVTVNDYLAKRDSEWMGEVFRFLGLEVGCIVPNIDDEERKKSYDADITYGTNNEFGFDYLRDNLKLDLNFMVQREFNYAIVDEVDSILIDEARTPLIISGPTEDNTDLYKSVDALIPSLKKDHYEIDEKSKSCTLTDAGHEVVENELKKMGVLSDESTLYDFENMSVVHHVNQALRAHTLYEKDKDYIVKDSQVMIIDEFTGRIMDGRRYSEGLHQALEAKERVAIQNENQTLASITFQNYFRMYPKLAGMTGTATTEAGEFADIYNLEVVEIPTNIPVARLDEDDEIYLNTTDKYNAIVDEIERVHAKKQPILVGTISIEKSEFLSALLKKKKIKHNVLNARHHLKEAEIIAQAGKPYAVTIATNMAGRGTDIKLGGNLEMQLKNELEAKPKASKEELKKKIEKQVEADKDEVIKAGGLFVLCTERHESRRIDNQLRGRSGRQGDPGRTKFYLSLEDDLMRIFGSEKIQGFLSKLGVKEGEAIVHPWISKSLERAQTKVEARNYDIRKTLLKFDDVMNDQRKVIFSHRNEVLGAEKLKNSIMDLANDILEHQITTHIPKDSLPEEWDGKGLQTEFLKVFAIEHPIEENLKKEGITEEELKTELLDLITSHYESKHKEYGEDLMLRAERQTMIMTIDQLWKDHLHMLDHLRTGIGLRAYGQKDPLNEYKIEAFNLFNRLLDEISEMSVQRLYHLRISQEIPEIQKNLQIMRETRLDPAMKNEDKKLETKIIGSPVKTHVNPEDRDKNDPSTWGKVSRNEECPCGSGKKYKHCHGQN